MGTKEMVMMGDLFIQLVLRDNERRSLCACCTNEATRWNIGMPVITGRPSDVDAFITLFRCDEHSADDAYVAFLERVKRSPVAVASAINNDDDDK